ncbi:MAG: branched-chain amino acid ABC transporter permease [Desulfobulbus propionicus]|nr:MAG: branched-chain amino acid ABC transporter permease [Desulfobulbus propionicus]
MKRFRIIKRQERPAWRSCCVYLGAGVLSLVLSGVILWLRGTSPLEGISALFQGAFGSRWAIEDSVVKAIPLFLCSLGVAAAFRLQIWNIGAEGQFALGAVGAAWVALTFPEFPRPLLLLLMAAGACLTGGCWGLVPALLRQRLGANEIIVTLMMNYIAIQLLEYLVYGVWKDPGSYGFPMTPMFSDQAVIGKIGSSGIHWGLFHCLVLGVAFWLFFSFTRTGYEIRASGDSMRAARYAGIRYDYLVALVMVISGALAGWAGFLEASANINRLQPSIMVGYGYTAIVIAWLAQLNPISIGIASFLLAGLRVGVENLQLDHQVPAAFGNIIEGLILMMVLAGGFFVRYKLVVRKT